MLVYSPFKSCLPALKFAPLLLATARTFVAHQNHNGERKRPSSSGGLPDHIYIQDIEESFIPKTFETKGSQNCSTPKIKTGTENLSGSIGCTSD